MFDDYRLEKSVWTDADFEKMGWHDANIWAMAYPLNAYEFLLDIDYIVTWLPPSGGEPHFRRWTAPATLLFHNVYQLTFDVLFEFDTSVLDLERSDPGTPRNAEYIGKSTGWLWTLVFYNGTISFRAAGFTQYFRRAPIEVGPPLSLEARGGISFDRPSEIGSGS